MGVHGMEVRLAQHTRRVLSAEALQQRKRQREAGTPQPCYSVLYQMQMR